MEVLVPRKRPKRSNKSQDLYCLVRELHWSYNSGHQLLSQHNSLGKDQSKFNLTIFFPPKKFEKKKCENTMFQIYCIGITTAGTSFFSPHNSLGKDQSKLNMTIFFPPKKFEKKDVKTQCFKFTALELQKRAPAFVSTQLPGERPK